MRCNVDGDSGFSSSPASGRGKHRASKSNRTLKTTKDNNWLLERFAAVRHNSSHARALPRQQHAHKKIVVFVVFIKFRECSALCWSPCRIRPTSKIRFATITLCPPENARTRSAPADSPIKYTHVHISGSRFLSSPKGNLATRAPARDYLAALESPNSPRGWTTAKRLKHHA